MDLCLNIEAETVIRPVDELFINIKNSWFGQFNSQVSKPFTCSADDLFDHEKINNKRIYPIFDIMRMIQFSRSSTTKQCIRCGNLTEAQTFYNYATKSLQANKVNCIYIQDSTSEKCLCGGYWVLASLQ